MSNEIVGPGAAQQTAAKPAAAAPQKSPEWLAAETRAAELEQRLAAADKKLRVTGIEVQKVGAEKKAFGAKLTAHDRMEKALKAAGLEPEDLEHFKLNPDRVLKKALGEKYWDTLVEQRISGAPSAEVLASELSRTKEEIRAELRAEAEAAKAEEQKAAQARDEQTRATLASEASGYVAKSKSEYPGFERYPVETVGKAVAQYIEAEWNRTGKALTNKEAADAVEWNAVAASFARGEDLAPKVIEKYRPQLLKLTEKLKPVTVAGSNEGQVSRSSQVERRTLSNDLTATTSPAKRSYRTDEERLAAIKALDLGR
jgi:hypothetical protein